MLVQLKSFIVVIMEVNRRKERHGLVGNAGDGKLNLT